MKLPQTIQFYKSLPAWNEVSVGGKVEPVIDRVEPATCVEAEAFVLRVLDESMQPEFRKGCMIVIDPTGLATDGSYVLARSDLKQIDENQSEEEVLDDLIFRQLSQQESGAWVLRALNDETAIEEVPCELTDIIGVIVQRAGVRRSYHKRYD